MKKRIWPGRCVVFCILLICGRVAFAHEYWLEPDRAKVELSEETAVRLMFGKQFLGGEEKPLQLERTPSFKLLGQNHQPVSLLEKAVANQKPAATVTARKAGAMLVAMERSVADIGFARAKFIAYATSEGYVFANGELPDGIKTVHETYSRHLKTLVQVGDKLNSAPLKTVGEDFEILSTSNPFDNRMGKQNFKVLLHGKACPGVLLSAVHRVGNELKVISAPTDKKGRCSLPISRDGRWLIRSVKIEKASGPLASAAYYRSYWASLTFGYE